METHDSKKKLDPLPESGDEFWKDADVHKVVIDKSVCEHRFVRNATMEAVCQCGAGLMLSPGMDVKEGHIYMGNELVI